MDPRRLEEEWTAEAASLAAEALEACTRCGVCRAACIGYRATRNPRLSPPARIEAAAKVLLRGEADAETLETLYTCAMCGACTALCPYRIEVWRLVHAARTVLARRGRQPRSLDRLRLNAARAGHSFTSSPQQPRTLLTRTAREAGIEPEAPAEALYVPSPFETTLYPHILRDSLTLLRSSGVEATVSTRALDLGGNAAIDAASLAAGIQLLEKAAEEAERLGARVIIHSGCGADAKLAAIAEKLGYKPPVRLASIYEAAATAAGGDGSGSCRGCRLYPSCSIARFERRLLPAVEKEAATPHARDKPPYTICCGGGGGLNYLREHPLAAHRDRMTAWRAQRLAQEAETIITPCIKCYTAIRYGALKAGLAKRLQVVHLTTHITRRLQQNPQRQHR